MTRPHRSGRPFLLIAAGGLAALTLGQPAAAQTAAGGNDGRALDANPGVGSGGNNRVENAIDFSARNDLITGNVDSGFGFRDDVGYSAPGAFLDDVGSTEFDAFRADSLRSDRLIANFNTRGQVQGGNIIVFDTFTAIPTNRQANTPTQFAPQGGVFRVNNDINNANANQLTINTRPENVINTRFDATPQNTIGVVTIPQGNALSVTVDPLTGTTRRARPNTGAANDPTALNRITPRPGGESRLPGLPDLSPQSPTNYVTPRTSETLIQGPGDNAELLAQSSAFADPSGRVKPTLQLGQLAANPATAGVTTMEQRVAALQDSIFGSTPGTAPGTAPGAAPGTPDGGEVNAYTKLLDEIREQSQQTAAERLANNALPDNRPDWMKALDEPTDEQVDDAEEGLEATLARIRAGLLELDTTGEAAGAAGGEDESPEDAERRAEANAALDELMGDLTYNVRLDTLVAERQGRINELFVQGEKELGEGRFLNAERTYRQVRLEAADNPLGQVGLIHAQLGAGMVRSAAFNLRSLFEDHPELIATRYGQNLLPPADRLEWLQKELQRMVDSENSNTEPGLMLAYLGHQVESRQLVRYGLAIAEDGSPLDPLLPVLRRIWLDQKPADAPGADAGK